MTNKQLYVIGTCHVDLKGPKRLEALLREISPDIIALEFHKDREISLKKKKGFLDREDKEMEEILKKSGIPLTPKQKKIILEISRKFNSLTGYEFTTSRNYADTHPDSRLEYIDLSVFRKGFQEFKEVFSGLMSEEFSEIIRDPNARKYFLDRISEGKNAFLQFCVESTDEMYGKMGELSEEYRQASDPEVLKMAKKELTSSEFQAFKQIYNPKRDEAMAKRIAQIYDNGSHNLVAIVGLAHVPGLNAKISDLNPTIITLADWNNFLKLR